MGAHPGAVPAQSPANIGSLSMPVEITELPIFELADPTHAEELFTKLLILEDTFSRQKIDVGPLQSATSLVREHLAESLRDHIEAQVRQVNAAWAMGAVDGDVVQVEEHAHGAQKRWELLPARRDRWKQLYAPDGTLKPEYAGVEGYKRFADQYYQGNMQYTFTDISAALEADKFAALGWGKSFSGTTQEYDEVRGRVLDERGQPLATMTGPGGYIAYADEHTGGKMLRAYLTVSAVLSDAECAALGWGKSFSGTTQEYDEVRGRVLDEQGRPISGLTGPGGYSAYADEHTVGKMDKAYQTVSAVLSDAEFATLGWGKQFAGTTQEYFQYRRLLISPQGQFNPEARGRDGLDFIAWSLVERSGNRAKDHAAYAKARQNLRVVLSEEEIIDFGWPKAKPKR